MSEKSVNRILDTSASQRPGLAAGQGCVATAVALGAWPTPEASSPGSSGGGSPSPPAGRWRSGQRARLCREGLALSMAIGVGSSVPENTSAPCLREALPGRHQQQVSRCLAPAAQSRHGQTVPPKCRGAGCTLLAGKATWAVCQEALRLLSQAGGLSAVSRCLPVGAACLSRGCEVAGFIRKSYILFLKLNQSLTSLKFTSDSLSSAFAEQGHNVTDAELGFDAILEPESFMI